MKKMNFTVALAVFFLSAIFTVVTKANSSVTFADCTTGLNGTGQAVDKSTCNGGDIFCCYENPGNNELRKHNP